MAKTPIVTPKYKIIAKFEVDAPVEVPDVIGAIFGQTEGLFGNDFDLKELQKLGKIGRVYVKITSKNGNKTEGTIEIPSALSKEETAILAATLETIDRIGPGRARVIVEKIEDVREEKRRYVLVRAKELLKKMLQEMPKGSEITERIKEEVKKETNIIEYGEDKLPAGKGILESNEIIIVEGRADVINLVKHGITNVIACNGIRVPKTIEELAKNKIVTVFVDGDRGGDLLLKELLNRIKVDYVARAPPGREVEELSEKEIIKCLRKKVPAFTLKKEFDETEKKLLKYKKDVEGTGGALLFDRNLKIIGKLPVDELVKQIDNINDIYAIVTDELPEELAEKVKKKGIEYVIVV